MNTQLTNDEGEVRELTTQDLRRMRSMDHVLPENLHETIRQRDRNGPQHSPTKVKTTIRLSPEVIEYFKAEGDGWQGRIDQALKEYIQENS